MNTKSQKQKPSQSRNRKKEKVSDREFLSALKEGGTLRRLTKGNSDTFYLNGFKVYDNSSTKEFSKHKGYVFGDVARCIYKTFENHTKEIYPAVSSYSLVREIEVMEEVAYIDINHCYLQVANKLGYIEKKDYLRILKNYKDNKIDICAAFSSLFKDIRCDYYNKKGKVQSTIECNNYFLETVRNNIINYSHKIMYDWCLTGKYFHRNVDGVWIPKGEVESLKSYLEGLVLIYKCYEGKYLSSELLVGEKGNFIHV